MYSRYQNRPEESLHPPKNYSGWAFAERKKETRPPSSHRIDVALPSPAPESKAATSPSPCTSASSPDTAPHLPPPSDRRESHAQEHLHTYDSRSKGENDTPHREHCDRDGQTEAAEKPSSSIGLPAGLGKRFPFSHGIGSDELILLGLIFLLSQNEHESDLPLWLTLLLFSG